MCNEEKVTMTQAINDMKYVEYGRRVVMSIRYVGVSYVKALSKKRKSGRMSSASQ
jgi:hypothetical protein